MSDFLIQKTDELNIERLIVLEQLKKEHLIHTYKEVVSAEDAPKGYLPIGTIPFVEQYLGIRETPIEIPVYLQTEEFLKRSYRIEKSTNLPKQGRYFLKNASKLKDFTLLTDLYNLSFYDINLTDNDYYVVSEEYDIESEYRIYVFDNKIESIAHYNGNPCILPDIALIEKAVLLISYNEKYLKSYTIDVMVGKRGTALIEIHNFTSVGLYTTIFGTNLLYAYRDGIEYLRKDNSIKYVNC